MHQASKKCFIVSFQNYEVASVTLSLVSAVVAVCMSVTCARVSATHAKRAYDWKGNTTVFELHSLTKPNAVVVGVDLLLTVFFIIDQILRFAASCNKKVFFTSILNINDLFCNIVTLIFFLYFLIENDFPNVVEFIAYLARVLRILRLLRPCRSPIMIFYTICLRVDDVVFILGLLSVVTVSSGALLYIFDFYSQVLGEIPAVRTVLAGYFISSTTFSGLGGVPFKPSSSWSYTVTALIITFSLFLIVMHYSALTETLVLFFPAVKRQLFEQLSPKDRYLAMRKKMRLPH